MESNLLTFCWKFSSFFFTVHHQPSMVVRGMLSFPFKSWWNFPVKTKYHNLSSSVVVGSLLLLTADATQSSPGKLKQDWVGPSSSTSSKIINYDSSVIMFTRGEKGSVLIHARRPLSSANHCRRWDCWHSFSTQTNKKSSRSWLILSSFPFFFFRLKVIEVMRHPHDRAEARFNTDTGISKEDEERYKKLVSENDELQKLIAQVSYRSHYRDDK